PARGTRSALLVRPTQRSSDLSQFTNRSFWSMIYIQPVRRCGMPPSSSGKMDVRTFMPIPSSVAKEYDIMNEKEEGTQWVNWRIVNRKSTRLNSSHVSISYAVF